MNAVLGRMASTAQELAHYHSGDGIILLPYSTYVDYLNILDNLCCLILSFMFCIVLRE